MADHELSQKAQDELRRRLAQAFDVPITDVHVNEYGDYRVTVASFTLSPESPAPEGGGPDGGERNREKRREPPGPRTDHNHDP